MKKIISVLLILTMFMTLTAFADESTSNSLQDVLVSVKTKIEVPEELSEFESNVSTYSGKTRYNFDWHTEDYEKSLSVSADEEGNILSYSNYSAKVSDKRLTGVTKSEIIAYADNFIEKVFPDIYSTLTFVPKSYSANGSSRYSFTYQRCMFDAPVKDNIVNITVCVSENDTLFIRNMSASIDYKTPFAPVVDAWLDDPTGRYMEAFPLELVYTVDWNSDTKTAYHELVYMLKDNFAGFISTETGEVVVEDTENETFKNESTNDSFAAGAAPEKGDVLTEQELAELNAVEGLLSVEQIEKQIKSVPYIKFPEGVSLNSSSLYKNRDGEYIYNIHYNNDDKEKYSYVSFSVNAKDGKLLSYNCSNSYDDITLSEKQKQSANQSIEKFLLHVAEEEFNSTELSTDKVNGNLVNNYYERKVNGIRHIDNGISVSFDVKNSQITSYYLNFTDGTFENPEEVVSPNAAYKGLREYSPFVIMYVKSGGQYIECFTLENGARVVDAMTGDVDASYNRTQQEYTYSDIEGHWVEEAATKLSEIEVGFYGGKLDPETSVNQEDYLTLLARGIYGYPYTNYSSGMIYEKLIKDGIITLDEKCPEAEVTREEAFVYLIRMAGLEKVAKLENIYKVNYSDSDKITEGRIGYCAILSGLGVINGSNGAIRPKDHLTRAEAIVMLYRYLIAE